jgi:hypothetical protein
MLCSPSQALDDARETVPNAGLPEGWEKAHDVKEYDESTLYNYINGESETFFPYGFKLLRVFQFINTADPQEKVEVQIYEMGSALDAFGIYSTYRTPEDEFIAIGAEGYIGETQVAFHQDKYFVKLHFVQPRGDKPTLLDLAKVTSDSLAAAQGLPEELKLITSPEIDAKTVRYIARAVSGYEFFPRGLQAETRPQDDAATSRVTVVICPSEADAASAMEKYMADLKLFNAAFVWEEQPYGDVLVVTEPPFERGAASRIERYIVIVSTGPQTAVKPYSLLRSLIENVQALLKTQTVETPAQDAPGQ